MNELVQRLELLLRTKRSEYFAQLQPGVTDDQLDAFAARFSVTLPQEFRDLYRWRNGQHLDYSESLHRNRMFCSLEEVAEAKAVFDEMIGFDFEEPEHWRRAWLPFLHNGGGSYLCIDTVGEDGRKPNQLVAFWKADADRPVEHDDLNQWLSRVIQALTGGDA